MARISDEQLSKLKNEISLVRLIEAQGYSLKKEGSDQVTPCVRIVVALNFHEEITDDNQIYNSV